MKVTYLQQFPYRNLPDDFSTRFRESVVTNPYYDLVDPELVRAVFRDGLDELMFAARAGFDAVAVTEHAQANYDMSPNPDLTAAAIAYATEVEGIEVAIHVIGRTLGKSREPRRVAEEYAVLDNISGGRLIAGFPVGLAYDANYNNGVPAVETRARYEENMELVFKAWTAREIFPWNGKYSQYPGVNIWPRPLQSPHPPVTIATSGTPNTTHVALKRDFGFNLVAFFGDPMILAKPVYDYFWQTAADLGVDDNPYRATYSQFVAVADTDAEAERFYGKHIEYCFANGIGHVPINRLAMPGGVPPDALKRLFASPPPPPAGPPSYRSLVETGQVVAGSADTVAERLEMMAKTFRVGNLSLFLQLGSTPHDLTQRSAQLFAEKVLPRLRPIFSEYDDDNRWWPVRLGGRPPSPNQVGFAGAVS
jgi:alkanesulfonate monooxygenase SsuD/methylene tetrahydromethanopterin reductase-like flavin-dependent oxidoreductase (luciferase family)